MNTRSSFTFASVHRLFVFILFFLQGIVFHTTGSTTGLFRQSIVVKEKWNTYHWCSDVRLTYTFDTSGQCISIMHEKWTGTKWVNDLWERFSYDDLHYPVSWLVYRWFQDSGWRMIEGTRKEIDTIDIVGNRVVLRDAAWDAAEKRWCAEDLTLYDSYDRVKKRVITQTISSQYGWDTTTIIYTTENSWSNDARWIQNSTIWRSDTRETTATRRQYRENSDSISRELSTISVDYWDEESQAWLVDKAKLFRVKDSAGIVYDSLVELRDSGVTPLYVELVKRDERGNLLTHRLCLNFSGDSRDGHTGIHYIWKRKYNPDKHQYTVAESTYTLEVSGWKLLHYYRQTRDISSDLGIDEWGYYGKETGKWGQTRQFDFITPYGLKIKGRKYFDSSKREWIPLITFSENRQQDSTIITADLFDVKTGKWTQDSMYIIHLNKHGKIVDKIIYTRTAEDALSNGWQKYRRIIYKDPNR